MTYDVKETREFVLSLDCQLLSIVFAAGIKTLNSIICSQRAHVSFLRVENVSLSSMDTNNTICIKRSIHKLTNLWSDQGSCVQRKTFQLDIYSSIASCFKTTYRLQYNLNFKIIQHIQLYFFYLKIYFVSQTNM